MNFAHRSVLLDECIESLDIKPDGIYVDGTAGGGGHSLEIVKRLTDGGRLIAIDRDDAAIAAATARLSDYLDRVTFVRNNFSSAAEVCRELGIEKIDGILLDLGVSSYQLDTAERGFTHNTDAPLDMRMDRRGELDAYTVVNTYSAEELKRVIWEYGEERFAPKIAQAIVRRREIKPIESTGELVDIIKSAIPAAAREGGHHPAKRTFQAIRIEVNGELDAIEPAIRRAKDITAKGGRIVIITFHSLEDRIVKQTFADMASGCTCPRSLPICVCGKKPEVKVLTKKPILPSERELEENPRSRSAKLRVCEKL
ncbi:MAG: 16S rRNA (cytosine(1402)-N(4))-methyltransferase RsmH [Clostridia bacterium]|nr:16S rRNA (cytosine(1402)-N(4))-methyltransferase RsmH [Clostridia bacterium]